MTSKVRKPLVKRINPTEVVNTELKKLCSAVSSLGLPEFGPDLSSLVGETLNDAVVGNRLIGKFMEPADGRERELHLTACHNMIAHDAGGFDFVPRNLPADLRRTVYTARNTLSEWYKDFRPTYCFRPPSGESALANQGLTDVFYKLQDTEHWQVSAGALPYAIAICYRNAWLKRVVKSHFARQEPTGRPSAQQKRIWYKEWESTKPGGSVGYFVFGKMFASLCSLNNVCRVTSIPKNAKARRVITMVPFWNMVCQLSLMQDMRAQLYNKTGVDIYSRAELHKTLIRHRSFATIDLKNASNSVWQSCVDFFFPSPVKKFFDRLVDKHYEVTLGDETHYGYFEMFSPMGCGLTFDVMTQMLLALGRAFDSSTSVFGDDIMLQGSNAPYMIRVLAACGLETNLSKTFVSGSISESCGGFYNHTTSEDITCFDFTWCENRVQAFASVNKLRAILHARQTSLELRKLLASTHQRLLHLLRRFTVDENSVWDRDRIHSDFILADFETSRRLTPVVSEVERMWQRKVVTVNAAFIQKGTKAAESSPALYASWFLRGKSYDPPLEDKLTYDLVDAATGTSLAGIQLVSFI